MLHNQIQQKKSNDQVKQTKWNISYPHIFACATTTLFLHPVRVGLNCAATTTTFLPTRKAIKNVFFKDAHINLSRGITATSMQSGAKDLIQSLSETSAMFNSMMTSLSAGIAGVPATFIETFFMRSNAIKAQQSENQPIPIDISNWRCKWKYNWPLAVWFTARELAFTVNVFSSKEASTTQRATIFATTTFLSSMSHKFATIESTKDILNITNQVPDWKEGYRIVFKKIMHNQYSLPALKCKNAHPKNPMQYLLNLYTTVGTNILIWRGIYLGLFGFGYDYLGKKYKTGAIDPNRLFRRIENGNKQIQEEEQVSATFRRLR